MNIVKIVREWRRKSIDPVKHCMVYRSVGCVHVDGMLCNMRTCDVVAVVQITPHTAAEIERSGRYEKVD